MTSTTTDRPITAERIAYMDLARSVILITGVVFHAAHIFADTGWMISSPWHSSILAEFVAFIRGFRMEALFLVSGFFSAVLVSRRGSRGFVVNRMVRMGVPLVFCGIVFNTTISMLCDHPLFRWTNLEHFSSGSWMYHLWNIGALLLFEASMFTTLWLLPSFHGWLARIRVPVAVAIVVYMALIVVTSKVSNSLAPHLPGLFFFDIGVIIYVPAYLLGYTVHQNVPLRNRLFDWKFALGLAFSVLALKYAVAYFRPEWGTERGMRLQHLAWTLVLFSLVRAFESKSPWVKRLSIASYTIYLLHLPLQFAMYRAFPLSEGYGSFVILWVVPIAVIWFFHVQVVERWKWAGFLFNGKVYDSKTRSF